MLKEASNKNVPVRKQDFKERGKGIALFKGVEHMVSRINTYARTKNVNLKALSNIIRKRGNIFRNKNSQAF